MRRFSWTGHYSIWIFLYYFDQHAVLVALLRKRIEDALISSASFVRSEGPWVSPGELMRTCTLRIRRLHEQKTNLRCTNVGRMNNPPPGMNLRCGQSKTLQMRIVGGGGLLITATRACRCGQTIVAFLARGGVINYSGGFFHHFWGLLCLE